MASKDFNELSGPWVGLSIQEGVRITESIRLTIRAGSIRGTGTDKDGEFELDGFYKARFQQVMLTRRYVWTTEPSQESVGVAFDYEGLWDGEMVHGHWHSRTIRELNGPFEMWPYREEDRLELAIQTEPAVEAGRA